MLPQLLGYRFLVRNFEWPYVNGFSTGFYISLAISLEIVISCYTLSSFSYDIKSQREWMKVRQADTNYKSIVNWIVIVFGCRCPAPLTSAAATLATTVGKWSLTKSCTSQPNLCKYTFALIGLGAEQHVRQRECKCMQL